MTRNDRRDPRTAGVWSPDLRSDNPLKDRAARLSDVFETERCPFNALERAEARLSEAERRRLAQLRQPGREEDRGERQPRVARSSFPELILRPPASMSRASDRAAFAERLREAALRPETANDSEPNHAHTAFNRSHGRGRE